MTAERRALLTTTLAPRDVDRRLPYAHPLERAGYRVEQRTIREASNLRQFLSAIRIGPRIRRYDLIVANEYSTALALGILALIFGARARMVVVTLNLSRRPLRVGVAPLQRIIDRGLARFDAIIVHSSPEIDQFAELHNLDRSRFHLVPWGFDLPAIEGPEISDLPPRYLCMIGRNNRDFDTVSLGLRGSGVSGVFVGVTAPVESGVADIRCFETLPLNDCLKIMAGAIANVILLKDATRGAGHITAVAGMLLAKPHVFSDVGTLAEYLRDERDGIAIPLHDPEAFRAAVRRLVSDPALARRMGEEAQNRARLELSHSKFMERVTEIILGKSDRRKPMSGARI